MVKYNKQEFLDTLLGMSLDSGPSVQTTDFAKFMLGNPMGMPSQSVPLAKDMSLAVQDDERKGTLSKVFDYLSAPLFAVTNTFEDALDDKGLVDTVGGNLGAMAARIVSPVAEVAEEIISIPGVETPWEGLGVEDNIEAWMDDRLKPRYTSDILEDRFGVDNKFAKYGGGFAADVLLDPLTYVGVGLFNPNKYKKGAEAAEAITKAAAGDDAVKAGFQIPEMPAAARKDAVTIDPTKALQSVVPSGVKMKEVPPTNEFSWSNSPSGQKITEANLRMGISGPSAQDARSMQAATASAARWAGKRTEKESDLPFWERNARIAENTAKTQDTKMSKTGEVFKRTKTGPNKGKGYISYKSVQQVIDDIENGFIPRTAPPIPAATGELAETGVREFLALKKNLSASPAVKRSSEMNPANQVNLYNRIYQKLEATKATDETGALSSKARKATRTETLQALRAAEDYAIENGMRGTFWDGTGLRLSDVISEVGENASDELLTKVMTAFKGGDLSKIDDPKVRKAIEASLGRRALVTGQVGKAFMTTHMQRAKIMHKEVSPYKYDKWMKLQQEKIARDAKMMGLTNTEIQSLRNLIGNAVDIDDLDTIDVIQELGPELIRAMIDKRLSRRQVMRVNETVARMHGETQRAMRLDTVGKTVADTVMTRLTTWYDRGEMKHVATEAFQTGETMAKHRAAWFNDKARRYSPTQIMAGFRLAQGHLDDLQRAAPNAEFEPGALEMADYIRDYMDNLFGGASPFAKDKYKFDATGTVAMKSSLVMEDINKQLGEIGSKFRFSNKTKTTNVKGEDRNYKELGWLRSWENVDPKVLGQDPLQFMYDLDLAVNRTLAEYALIDDFVMRFGRFGGDADFDPLKHTFTGKIHHRLPAEVAFEPEVARQFQNLLADIEKGPWRPKSSAGVFYGKALRMWKTGVTIYYPSHHVRNMIGDSWLMWTAGINDPNAFKWGKKIIHSQRARYKDAIQSDNLDALRLLTSKEEFGYLQAQGADVILKKHGANLTADELYGEAFQRALLPDANRLEDIIGEPLFANTAGKDPNAMKRYIKQPLGGQAHKAATTLSEYRDHFVRLSHFSAAIDKRLTPAVAKKLRATDSLQGAERLRARREILNDIYEDAAKQVRKFHPDGRDLTQFEQKVRMVVPFYSWTRKAIPLLMQAMYTRPAKVTAYPKAWYNLQGALGIEGISAGDPFPEDQLFTDWMVAGGMGPFGDPESDNAISAWWGKLGKNAQNTLGEETGYTIVDPGNPFNDTVSEFGGLGRPSDLLRGLGSSLTPALNVPFELMTDRKLIGTPISEGPGAEGYAPYLAEQVPALSAIQRILQIGEDRQEDAEPNSTGMQQSLINMFTAAGILGTGQYTKSAEFDVKDALKKAAAGNG